MGISCINWTLSASEIRHETNKLIDKTRSVYDEIGSLTTAEVSFENTIKVLLSVHPFRFSLYCHVGLVLLSFLTGHFSKLCTVFHQESHIVVKFVLRERLAVDL